MVAEVPLAGFIKGEPTPRSNTTLAQAFHYRLMEDRNKKPYLTEGRKQVINSAAAEKTGRIGETSNSAMNNRLRRFHYNGLNVLFYDGRVERSSASDQEFRARFFD